ncbi:MAG: RidA family protein [Elusimicrobiota bacterium]|jgi:2-iminobutanoate/2-iminopropanoate deaminase|nr:RidA family protein [Elusimicrobiota bacterium]
MKIINSKDAPAAIGPYSQAVQTGNLLFISGQLPMDPKTLAIVSGGIKEQTVQSLANIKAIIEAAGSAVSDVVRCGIFLTDLKDFAVVNEIYGNFFGDHKPARACVEVSKLPKDALVEIEAVVYVKNA